MYGHGERLSLTVGKDSTQLRVAAANADNTKSEGVEDPQNIAT